MWWAQTTTALGNAGRLVIEGARMKFAALVWICCWGALAADGPATSPSDESAPPTTVSAPATLGSQRQGSTDAACMDDCEVVRPVYAGAPNLQRNAEELFEEAKALEGRDPLKARSLYERACDLDHGESCSRGAVLYENGSLNRSGVANTVASYRLYIFGCANSYWNACFMLGHILTQRHSVPYPNVPRDTASGFRYYELACANGVKSACDNIKHVAP